MLFSTKLKRNALRGEDIQRAFELAYLLHPERFVAWSVTRDAYDRLPSIQQLEAKSRKSQKAFKMPTPEIALPQVSVFYASESWERNQEYETDKREPAYEPTIEDMTARYIKFIVMNTMHRDSSNVAVALGSLLYTYSSSEICNLAPDIFNDDNIRRAKKRIKDSLESRFSNGRDSISLRPANMPEGALTVRLLKTISPWVSEHSPVKEGEICLLETYFSGRGSILDWRRNHVLFDPECGGLSGLIREFNDLLPCTGEDMRLEEPETKLSIPIFYNGGKNQNDRFIPPSLNSQETYSIKEWAEKNRRRRERFSSGRIRICADGKELTHFHSSANESGASRISSTTSYIEVFGKDDIGEFLLGFFPLSSLDVFDSANSTEIMIRHVAMSPNWQELLFSQRLAIIN